MRTNLRMSLKRSGLNYCRFLDLWRSEFVKFSRVGEDSIFPNCEPCYLTNYQIKFENPSNAKDALKQLAVFIRLWHKLQQVNGAKYSFVQLRDICEVLHLFKNGAINPGFY
jgi:hypothetical protein